MVNSSAFWESKLYKTVAWRSPSVEIGSAEIQINQFQENFFWLNFIFCDLKNDQKSIFELGKSLKLAKIQFHEKKFPYYYRIALVSNGLGRTYQPARLGIYSATALLNGRYYYTHEKGR